MRNTSGAAFILSLSLPLTFAGAGCFLSPVPDLRTPADHARKIEPRCRGFGEASVAPLLQPSAFDSVGPAYSYVKSGPNDPEARLRGARIQVRPLPGMSRESLTRTLECHEARVTLDHLAVPANDPYTLPDRWVDIDVESTGDGFVVLVRADNFDDAHHVLERAKAFSVPHD
jgi:hypothetical protein